MTGPRAGAGAAGSSPRAGSPSSLAHDRSPVAPAMRLSVQSWVMVAIERPG